MKSLKKILIFILAFVVVFTTCDINQFASAKSISTKSIKLINPNSAKLTLGKCKTYQLKTEVLPSNATNKKLVYKSSNNQVVSVTSKGVIKGVEKGNATITISLYKNSKINKKVMVTVGTEVEFKFYSSSAQNVYLAGEMNNWSYTANKMKKDGNWFTTSIPLEGNVEYKFVADSNWLIDPFSLDTKGDYGNSYLDLEANGNTNMDCDIYAFSSEHFDYFSLKNIDKTDELEDIYSTLTNKLLKFMKAETKQSKIRYYGIDYTNNQDNSWYNYPQPFATYESSEVNDLWDCNSSHEIIHLLVSVDNTFFNEGIAQCFQYEGNINYKDQNVNLITNYQLLTSGTTDFMNAMAKSIQTTPSDYCVPASFIYYNTEVLDNDAEFAKFLYSLSFSDSLTNIQTKYQTATGKNMSSVVTEWENWLKTINTSSDIYIEW